MLKFTTILFSIFLASVAFANDSDSENKPRKKLSKEEILSYELKSTDQNGGDYTDIEKMMNIRLGLKQKTQDSQSKQDSKNKKASIKKEK